MVRAQPTPRDLSREAVANHERGDYIPHPPVPSLFAWERVFKPALALVKDPPMNLVLGSVAPAFKLPSKPGEEVDVGALFGHEKVVILFFPFAYSSVCSEEMCHFRDHWAEWTSLGCKVFGVSIDSPFVVDKFRADLGIPFPVLSDFNKTVATQYDALHDELMGLRGVTKRAAVVIGTDGKIAYAWAAEIPKTQVDFEAIKAAVAAAR